MPRIDPLQLLTCLKVLLDKNGGILSLNEVKRIAGLMTKYSKKLVSKCIYIQILKCTKTDLLGEFMGAGGWQLVNLWLSDGLRAMNYPLVTEILELFLLCPVDVERLKSNTSPKLVKQLSREGPPDVRILATRLVEQWLNIVKASNLAANNQIGKHVESDNQDLKLIKNKTESNEIDEKKIETNEASKLIANKNLDYNPKSLSSPKRKMSTESSSSLTLKIVVKDGKQVVSKVDDQKENNRMADTESNQLDEMDADLDPQSESDESTSKLSNKENENKHKETETVEGNESKESKDKDKTKEKDKHKEKSKDKSKSSSSKDKERHKNSSSSSKSSKTHSSTSSKSSTSSSSSSSKSKHSSSKSSSRDKERDSDKDHKHKSSSKSSSKDKYKHEKEKSVSKEREKEKANQAEKDKDTLNKVMSPSLEKLGKIPKKPKDPNDNQTPKPMSITIPSKKASMSIEIRKDSDKAKTVKTYKSQFRSHGLTEEAPPPPSRKQLKKSVIPTPVPVPTGGIFGSSSFASSLKRSSPPLSSNSSSLSNANIASNTGSSQSPNNNISGPPAEKKPKIDMIGVPSTVVEKPGSIKLIAPKPKPSLVESDMFMDALSASAYKKHSVSKRKRRPSNSANAESPTTTKAEPLKFYQDTLEAKDEDKNESNSEMKNNEKSESEKNISAGEKSEDPDDDDDIPLKKVKEDIDQKTQTESNEANNGKSKDDNITDSELEGPKSPDQPTISVKKPPGPGCGPNGPPGVLMLSRRSGPKKKLKWRAQEELEEIRYFELDENERVNVTKAFTDMKNMERMHERESFLLARKLNNEDLMVEQTQWRPLILIDDVPPHPEGLKSKEKTIQADREKTTLKALYFSHAMIPDSPSEPDMEQYLITEPKIIPLDDITGNNTTDTVNDFVSYGYPEPKGTPPTDHQDEEMDVGLGLNNLPGTEIPFGNQPNQYNPFLPFSGQPTINNNMNAQNSWVGGLGPNGNNIGAGGLLPPNNMNNLANMNNLNILRPNMGGPINGPMNGPLAGPLNGPPPLMGSTALGSMNNAPFNMQHNIMPFGPNGPNPNGILNGPPQSLLGSIFGPSGIQQQRMNMNNANNGPMHNQMGVGNRNNLISGVGGNWRSSGPANNNAGGNWRSNNNNDRSNNRTNDRNNWMHGNANRAICKQFTRGFCRNGSKCNYYHPGNNQRI